MTTCQIYNSTDENITKCSDQICNGNIVVFPTETVYGIGSSALNPEAVNKIYKIKKRPSNNPLIMHVLNWDGAKLYTNLNDLETKLCKLLTDKFWPGPLTILVKKSSYVINEVCAGNNWVALRASNHRVLRKLIEKSMVPIVAPSANISGKVTSTYKDHVINYFKNNDISIITEDEPSNIGIESTIVKIDNNDISIVRPGFITKEDIINCLSEIQNINITQLNLLQQTNSPGSDISHYTTNKKTYMFNFEIFNKFNGNNAYSEQIKNTTREYLKQCAIIDFKQINSKYYDYFGAHVDISESGNLNEALFNLYNVLHQINLTDIKVILIFDFWSNKNGLYNTIYDRFYRCASGKYLLIPLNFIE